MSSIAMPSFIRNFRRRFSDRIFEDGDELFMESIKSCKVYAQYGFKKSILWALKNTEVPIYMVDTSQQWISFYHQHITIEERFHPCWVDVGEIGHFGAPVNYEKQQNFPIYTDWLWEQENHPDFVLIGGRFRVCSFLTSLKRAEPGAKLLFDDYFNRPHYHFVEDFSQPTQICGRQALFEVPNKSELDMKLLDQRIAQFRMVTD